MDRDRFERELVRLQDIYADARVIPIVDEVFERSGYTRTGLSRPESSSCCGVGGIELRYEKSDKPKAYVTIHFANILVSLWLRVEGSTKQYSSLSYDENSTGFVEKSARLAWADVIDRPWTLDERSHQYDRKWKDR